MENEVKWRFPGNRNGDERGLTEANIELFKKDIRASLAREILQNSIDAKIADNEMVRVEFNCFDVPRSRIPNLEKIEEQITRAINTWNRTNPDMVEELKQMLGAVSQETIHCCRISDFYTKGLEGLSDDPEAEDSPYHLLIKGLGISNKGSTSGGSKGVGKYAAFVNSEFNTVFYSSKTIRGEEGYIGISKLCSALIPDSPTREKTQGVGYYGRGDQNASIPGQFNLDDSFIRDGYGTDIFIIGFYKTNNWQEEIIAKVLDSFMYAIWEDQLVVKVGNYEIRRDNLADYVYNPSIINPNDDKGKKVLTQYMLLVNPDDQQVFDIDNYGEVEIRFISLKDRYTEFRKIQGTCTMIRYPFMKICELKIEANRPYVALCVIGKNKLNECLRTIENVEHTSWETGRLKKKDGIYPEINRMYKALVNEITEYIRNKFLSSEQTQTNLYGAEDYVPQVDDLNEDDRANPSQSQEKKKLTEKASFTKRKVKTVNVDVDAAYEDKFGNGSIQDYGGDLTNADETIAPEGHNQGKSNHFEVGDTTSSGREEGNEHQIAKRSELRSIRRHFLCTDKRKGEFRVIAIPDETDDDVELQLFEDDEEYKSNNKRDLDPVHIKSAKVNGIIVPVINELVVRLSLKAGEKVTIDLVTDRYKNFGAEVNFYANRK